MLATAYLSQPGDHPAKLAVAIFGADRFLKQRVTRAVCEQVLGADDPELALTRFEGPDAVLSAVMDELRTVSMWGDRRIVVVADADDFVSRNRAALEKYLDKPAQKGLLVLEAKTWPATTRLAKKIAEMGLSVDCRPLTTRGGELQKWLAAHAKQTYGTPLARDAADLLLELAGVDLGLLDQELQKLSAFVGKGKSIDVAAVRALVGGWKVETTWSMLDAVRDGATGTAMQLLDKLLAANEHPLKLLGGINYTFRSLAQATETSRRGVPLKTALEQAGVKPFAIEPGIAYLKRIGRGRAEQIYQWLVTAEADLKGASPLPERIVLERLLLRLAGKI